MDDTSDAAFPDSPPEGIQILARVATGRRSTWFRAHQTRLDRDIALKQLRPFLAESQDFTDRFLDAGRKAASIIHPAALHVINLYPKHHAIAIQWADGKSLADKPEGITPLRAANIGLTVMDCLATLHATDRCHGNLSPGNILISPDGTVWITDFFHPPIMNDGVRLFRSGQRYIAPELMSGSSQGDWRSDVFSLGCILFDLVSAAPEGCSRDFLTLLEYMRALDPDRRGETPQNIVDVLKKIKAKEEARAGHVTEVSRRRRMYRRVPGEFDVSMRRRSATPGETATILNKIKDIGESGVFIETDDELLGVGSIIELDFTLKGVDGNVHAFGIVRWQSKPPMPKGVGIQFMEVDQEGLTSLRRFLDSRNAGEQDKPSS